MTGGRVTFAPPAPTPRPDAGTFYRRVAHSARAAARLEQLERRAGDGWILDLRSPVLFDLHVPAPHRIVWFCTWRADAVYFENVGSLACPRWTRIGELWLPASDAAARIHGAHAAIEHDFSLLQLIA